MPRRGNNTEGVVSDNTLLSQPTSSSAMALARQPAVGQAIALHCGADSQQFIHKPGSAALDSTRLHVFPTMPASLPPCQVATNNVQAPAMPHLFGGNLDTGLLLLLSSTRSSVARTQTSTTTMDLPNEGSGKTYMMPNFDDLRMLADVASRQDYEGDAGASTAERTTSRPQIAQNPAESSRDMNEEMDDNPVPTSSFVPSCAPMSIVLVVSEIGEP